MKRILAMLRRDLLSTTKDHLLTFSVLAPFLMALGLRLFMPAVGQAAINVVVTPDMPAVTVEKLRPYLNVEVVGDRDALDRRVMAYDDAVGIVPDGSTGYTLVLEGNEAHDSAVLPGMVLQYLRGGDGMAVEAINVGSDQPPFREIIGGFIALGAIVIAGTMMAFYIIEDKESRMMLALGASPLGRSEYVTARSLIALMLAVVMTFGSLWILGLSFDPLQMLVLVLIGSLAAVVLGFIIGSVSANQIAGVANLKLGSLLVLIPAAVTLLVPESYWTTVYWVPTYWTYVTAKAILTGDQSWPSLLPMLGWNLATGLAFLAVAYPWLKAKLDFARG